MFGPTTEQLARQLTIDKELSPRRLDICIESQTESSYHNKTDDVIKTIMEYKNEISSR